MSGAAQAPRLAELLGPLRRHRVDFVVIGGIAGLAHGSSYPSFDLDIAYSREPANLEALAAALEEIGVRLRGAPDDLPFTADARTLANGSNFTFATRYGDLDVLAEVAGIRNYADLRAAAETRTLAGLEVPVCSIDHLIAMKRGAARPKDERMLEDYIVIADEQQRARRGDDPS